MQTIGFGVRKFLMPSLIQNPARFKDDFKTTVNENDFPEYGIESFEASSLEGATTDMATFFMDRAQHLPTFTEKLEPSLHWIQFLNAPDNWDIQKLYKRLPKEVQSHLERLAKQPFGVFVFQATDKEKSGKLWDFNRLSKVIPYKLLGKPDKWLTLREYSLEHSIAVPGGTEAIVLELAPKEQLLRQLQRVFGTV